MNVELGTCRYRQLRMAKRQKVCRNFFQIIGKTRRFLAGTPVGNARARPRARTRTQMRIAECLLLLEGGQQVGP